MKDVFARAFAGLRDEWAQGVSDGEKVVSVRLLTAATDAHTETARLVAERDREAAAELRRVRDRIRGGAVSSWDLEALDTVIARLDPGPDDRGTT